MPQVAAVGAWRVRVHSGHLHARLSQLESPVAGAGSYLKERPDCSQGSKGFPAPSR